MIVNSVGRFCRLLLSYGEDALLVLQSIVRICEQWRERQDAPA